MSSTTVLDLVRESRVYQSLDPDTAHLLERFVELLSASPEGLSALELKKRVGRRNRILQEKGIKGFTRVLESYGVFRLKPDNRYTLVDAELLARPLATTPVAVLDVEATGGRPPMHRLIELALFRRDAGQLKTFTSLADPNRPLPRYVTRVTGIESHDLVGAPTPEAAFRNALHLLEDAVLIFHGAGPDLDYLNYEAIRTTGKCVPNAVTCTTRIAKYLEPTLAGTGLDSVLTHLGFEVEIEHRALEDARLTLKLYELFEARFEAAGIHRVIDLTFFQGVVNTPRYFAGNLSVELVNSLPAEEGVFLLRDDEGRVVHGEFTGNIRDELHRWFYSDHALPTHVRNWLRKAASLQYRSWDRSTPPGQFLRDFIKIGHLAGMRGEGDVTPVTAIARA